MALERGQLDEQKRHLRIVPLVPPILNQQRMQFHILLIGSGVGFALIPDDSANRVHRPRRDHRVVECGREIGVILSEREIIRRSRACAEFLRVDFEFDLVFPCSVQPDAVVFVVAELQIEQRLRSCHAAVGVHVRHPHRDGVGAGPDQFARNFVDARHTPVVRSRSAGGADLFAVEKGFVAVIDRAEGERQLLAGPLRRNRDGAAIPENPIEIGGGRTRHFLALPAGVVKIGIFPRLRRRRRGRIERIEALFPGVESDLRFFLQRRNFLLLLLAGSAGAFDLGEFAGTVGGAVARFADPALDRRAAPAGVDHADRDVQILVQLAREIVAERAEGADRFGRADHPARTGDLLLLHARSWLVLYRRMPG